MATATAKKAQGKAGKGKKNVEREVIFPKVAVEVYAPSEVEGSDPINADLCMEWLGWKEETEDDKFGTDFLFRDMRGEKIRCINNDHNRPFDEVWARQLAQDILNKNYQMNCETIIRSKTGRILSGQHRLIGLVLAHQMWDNKDKKSVKEKWKENWPTEPTIESLVAVGCSEDPKVTRTLDNVRTRTFSDVLFADTGTFGKVKDKKTRIMLVRTVDTCVSFLWERLLRKRDSWEPRKTHSAALDFMATHPHVEDCVKWIAEQNADNAVGWYVSPGVAAGLMYLMGSANSDPLTYNNMDEKREGSGKNPAVNWALWEKAKDFWADLAGAKGAIKAVRDAFTDLRNAANGRDGTKDEKCALLILAWNLYCQGKKIVPSALKLSYQVNEETGRMSLDTNPLVGPLGLDKGCAKKHKDTAPEVPEEDEPEEEEIKETVEEKKARIKQEKEAAKKNGKATSKAKLSKAPVDDDEDDEEDDEEEEIEEGSDLEEKDAEDSDLEEEESADDEEDEEEDE